MIKTAEEFIRLRTSDIQEEYVRAGKDEAPITVWLELIEKYPHMRIWVARNKTIPIEVINILSKDEDSLVRDSIASKYPLSREIYLMLSKDKDESVRGRLIYNKKLPLDILKDLSERDPSEFVRNQATEKYQQVIDYKQE